MSRKARGNWRQRVHSALSNIRDKFGHFAGWTRDPEEPTSLRQRFKCDPIRMSFTLYLGKGSGST